MRKILFILLTIVSSGLSAQQKIENVQCAVNAQGLITLQECPTEHPQLSVNINDACNHVTIYLNGQVFQELETDDEFISPTDDKSVHYLDANFDGHCDIFVGPGCSRTYSSLFIWNPKNGKYEEAIGDAPLQNFMIDPSSKLVYDGGSSSYCEEDAFKMKWTDNRLEKLEEVSKSFPGIASSYAIQAGREIRIMVKPEDVSEDQMVLLARDIAKKIEEELTYPGQIKVHLLRETKAIDYAK